MLSLQEFARKVNGPSLEREIDRQAEQGGENLDLARILSQRVNWTVDWEELGNESAPWEVYASRGEAVIFYDTKADPTRVIKLRGLEKNGFPGGYGCILGFNEKGEVDLIPGTIPQVLEREELSEIHLGFSCQLEAILEDESGILLSQRFVVGEEPTLEEIADLMLSEGWQSAQKDRDLAIRTRRNAWYREGILAVDANQTNLVRAEADGQVYPIDLIIWHDPRE